jgi:hypothetical protein
VSPQDTSFCVCKFSKIGKHLKSETFLVSSVLDKRYSTCVGENIKVILKNHFRYLKILSQSTENGKNSLNFMQHPWKVE